MTDLNTTQFPEPPRQLRSLLTPGAIKSMVDGSTIINTSGRRTNHGSSMAATTTTKMDTSTDSTNGNTLYTVCSYPHTISIPETNNNPGRDRVYITGNNFLYIYDGTHYIRAILLDQDLGVINNYKGRDILNSDMVKTSMVILHVKSYVTSHANLNQDEPLVYLTKVECSPCMELPLFKQLDQSNKKQVVRMYLKTQPNTKLVPPGEPFRLTQGRVMGSKITDFLSNIAPYLSYETLSGCCIDEEPYPYIPSSNFMKKNFDDLPYFISKSNIIQSTNELVGTTKKLQIVSDFLLKHQAIDTLTKSKSVLDADATTTIQQLPSSISLHMSVLDTFRNSQMDRQKASLTSNGGRSEPTPTTVQLIQQHQDLLQKILQTKRPWMNTSSNDDEIDINMLHWCHHKLCNNLIPDCGQFRMKTVRVGTTNFVYNGHMDNIVLQLISSIQQLRTRLIHQYYISHHYTTQNQRPLYNSLSSSISTTATTIGMTQTSPNQQGHIQNNANVSDRTLEQQRLLASLTYAAAVCMGILDTHPYSDGNGRLARIVLNWILFHQLNVPFTIPLFATPEQRTEYTKAICKTRRNITLQPIGNVPDDIMLAAYEQCGVFQPMVELILDRLYKSVTEFNKLVIEKENFHVDEVETRTARKLRERTTASGVCQICLDGQPNISSLCCGIAYHMKCLAQWLKSNASCPQCRSEIPSLESNTRTRTSNPNNNISDIQILASVFRNDIDQASRFLGELVPHNVSEYSDDTVIDGIAEAIEEQLENVGPSSDLRAISNVFQGDLSRIATMIRNIIPQDYSTFDHVEYWWYGALHSRVETTANGVTEDSGPDDTASSNNDSVQDDTVASDPDDTASADQNNDDTVESDPNDTTSYNGNPNQPPECRFCSNLSAMNCRNSMCRRCCINHGEDYCSRHS